MEFGEGYYKKTIGYSQLFLFELTGTRRLA